MANDALHVRAAETALVVVDVQDKLVPTLPYQAFEDVVRNIVKLISFAARMQLPVAISEQNPRGLGPTVPVLKEAASRVQPAPIFLDKQEFSIANEPLFQSFLGHGRRKLVVVGMETHVCVYQSVRALVERGYVVHVPADAVISRTETDRAIGLQLIERAGGIVTSTETILFDLLERAGTDLFRALAPLLREKR